MDGYDMAEVDSVTLAYDHEHDDKSRSLLFLYRRYKHHSIVFNVNRQRCKYNRSIGRDGYGGERDELLQGIGRIHCRQCRRVCLRQYVDGHCCHYVYLVRRLVCCHFV